MIIGHVILLHGCCRTWTTSFSMTFSTDPVACGLQPESVPARRTASGADILPAGCTALTCRRLADAPVSGRPVEVVLRVRRFFCDNDDCRATTFAEQVPGLTSPRARRTGLLTVMLEAIGLALAGRAGSRLADKLGMVISRDSMLRLVRALPDSPIGTPQILGVDDFALRRGHVYGTVIIDILTHRPLDLLADRTSETLAAWLREHPGVQIVCRDRAGAYAEGIRVGAPDAVQVADRWHLWHNLVEAVEKVVRQHHADLIAPAPAPAPIRRATPPTPGDGDDDDDGDGDGDGELARSTGPTRLAARTSERFSAVHGLLAAGTSASAISEALGLDRKTVRRFARAGSVAELLTAHPTRASMLDDYAEHLQRRWAAGATDAVALSAEITALGYRGSAKTVRRYLQPLRGAQPATQRPPTPPTTRDATGWLTRHPDSLTNDERAARDAVLDRSPALRATRDQPGQRLRRDAHPTPRPRTSRLDEASRHRRRPSAALVRHRAGPRSRRRHRRTDPALQLRRRRRRGQPHQDDQTPDVRSGQLRPTPQASPPRDLNTGRSRKVRQSHF
jgi:DNA-binding NarL/FixJ family response regulator